MLNIYDSIGRVDPAAIDPAEVEKLPEPQRAALFECIKASRAAEDGEDRLGAARKLVVQTMRDYDVALAADQEANPPIDHITALRDVIAANNPNAPKRPQRKIDKETRAALDMAVTALAEARAELANAEVSLRTLSV